MSQKNTPNEDDLNATIWDKFRGRHPDDRRQSRPDWLKELAPYAIGAAVIYGQFMVMQEKIERLEQSVKAQWEIIGELRGR